MAYPQSGPGEGGESSLAEGPVQSSQVDVPQGPRPEDYLEVKAEKDKATLLVKGIAAKDRVELTRDHVGVKLIGLQVTSGVDWNAVDEILAKRLFDKTHVIAANKPPGQSRDAWIEEKIKIDSDVKPVEGQDGLVDFKNVDNIHQVKKGDVLAVKHPAVQGEPGVDIFGRPQPAAPAKDVVFRVGLNTEVSADGLSLLAATGGYVYRQGVAIHVGVTYTLRGDVDFKTGNLHYQGDILIQGSVRDGFEVRARGDVTVEGNVDAAEIVSLEGSVTVKAAVFGHGKGSIKAKKGIRLLSAQDIALECEGEIEVEAQLLNCRVVAGSLRADKAGCAVVGGDVKAYKEIRVAVVGGEGCRTELRIADKEAEAARKSLGEIEAKQKAIAPRLEAMEKKLKAMKALAERAGSLSPRSAEELKAALNQYAALRKAAELLENARKAAHAAGNSSARNTGRVVITETVVWGAGIDLYGHPRELEAEDAKKDWAWTFDGVAGRTILPDPVGGTPPQAPNPPSAAPRA